MKYFILILFTLIITPNLHSKDSPNILIPNGRESFLSGENIIINWKSKTPENVDIYFKQSEDEEWELIKKSASGEIYNWTAPKLTSENCRIKLEQLIQPKAVELVSDYRFGGSREDKVIKVIKNKSGNFIVCCESDDNERDRKEELGYTDFWIYEMDINGNLLWEKSYGGSKYDYIKDITPTKDDGFIVIGNSNSYDNHITGDKGINKILVLKLDKQGQVVWNRTYGGNKDDYCYSIKEADDNTYYITGSTNSTSGDFNVGDQAREGIIFRINDSGNLLSTKYIGGSDWDEVINIFKLKDDGFIVIGHSSSIDGDIQRENNANDIFVLKLDSDFNVLKLKTIGGSKIERVNDAIIMENNSIILIGNTSSPYFENLDPIESTVSFALRLNSDLTTIWVKQYGGSNYDNLKSMIFNSNDELITVGETYYIDGDNDNKKSTLDTWISKIDQNNGKMIWSKNFGGSNNESLNSICEINKGQYLVGGYTDSYDGDVSNPILNKDCWVMILSTVDFIRKDSTDNYFTIKDIADLKLKLTNPVGKEVFSTNDNIDIKWNSENSEKIQLSFSSNNGKEWEVITDEGKGKIHNWFIPDIDSDSCFIKAETNLIINEPGKIEWERTYGGTGNDDIKSCIETLDGGFVFISNSTGNGGDISYDIKGGNDLWIVKLDSLGRIEWDKSYGGSKDEKVKKIIQTKEENFLIIGYSESDDFDIQRNNGKEDYLVLKLDKKGNILYSKSFGGLSNDQALTVLEYENGDLLIGGNSNSNEMIDDSAVLFAWLIMLDSSGNIVWENTYKNGYGLLLTSMDRISNNNLLLSGLNFEYGAILSEFTTRDYRSNGFVLLKLDNDGNEIQRNLYEMDEYVHSIQTFIHDDNSVTVFGIIKDDSTYHHPNALMIYIIDKEGRLTLRKKIEERDDSYIYSACLNDEGEFILALNPNLRIKDTLNHLDRTNLELMKVSPQGEITWRQLYGGSGNEYINDIILTKDRSMLFSGTTSSFDGDIGINNFSNNLFENIRKSFETWTVKLHPDEIYTSDQNGQPFSIESNKIFDFIIYPNSSSSLSNIVLTLLEDMDIDIQMFDLTGRMISKIYSGEANKGLNEYELDLKPLAPGSYYVRLITQNITLTEILVVQR